MLFLGGVTPWIFAGTVLNYSGNPQSESVQVKDCIICKC